MRELRAVCWVCCAVDLTQSGVLTQGVQVRHSLAERSHDGPGLVGIEAPRRLRADLRLIVTIMAMIETQTQQLRPNNRKKHETTPRKESRGCHR